MSPAEIGRFATAALLTALLAWAAITDIRERRIPNWLVLVVLGAAIPWLLLGGAPIGSALAAGAIALTVTFVLFAAGVFGAGDAKLFSGLALFVGLANLPTLAVATSLAGGAMALVMAACQPTRALVMLKMRGAGDWGRGIPYGVAIAIGGGLVVWSQAIGAPLELWG